MNQFYPAGIAAPPTAATNGSANFSPRIAIIIPACDEEPCIGRTLEELLATIDASKFVVAVGVNGSTDRTAALARQYPVTVVETPERGYGFGCQCAIGAMTNAYPSLEAYIFFAADGASDPRDVQALVAAHEQGYAMVLGTRTRSRSNWAAMSFPHVVANFALAMWCGLLGRHWFTDLAPHRLIERALFEEIAPREMTFGWTIEAQIAAALLGAAIREVPARERRRTAGEQKVSGVTWRRTFVVGCRILTAGWRTRARWREKLRAPNPHPTVEIAAPSRHAA